MSHEAIASALAMLPASTREISEHIGLTQEIVAKWMRELRAGGLVAPVGFRKHEGRIFAFTPQGRPYPRAGKEHIGVIARFCCAWRALARRHSTDSLATSAGCNRRTASRILRCMRDAGLGVRIAGYEMREQTRVALYDRLPAPDVPRPAPQTRNESNTIYRARRSSSAAQEQSA